MLATMNLGKIRYRIVNSLETPRAAGVGQTEDRRGGGRQYLAESILVTMDPTRRGTANRIRRVHNRIGLRTAGNRNVTRNGIRTVARTTARMTVRMAARKASRKVARAACVVLVRPACR